MKVTVMAMMMSLLMMGHVSSACYQTGFGKETTADGAVLLSYNNEFTGSNRVLVKATPPTADAVATCTPLIYPSKHGYQHILVDLGNNWYTSADGYSPEGGLNDAGVAMVFGVATYVSGRVASADPWVNDGASLEMWEAVLQRADNVTSAINMIETMLNTCGAAFISSASFMVADSDDIWTIEVVSGHNWVASRVPRNQYLAQPNTVRTGVINFNDRLNFRTSPNIVAFATSLGLYSGSGPFSATEVFADTNINQPWSRTRIWAITDLVSPIGYGFPRDDYSVPVPLYQVPDAPMTLNKLRQVQHYHYEGTVDDLSNGYTLGSPHKMNTQPLCKAFTTYSLIMHLKAGKSYMFLSPSANCLSTTTPFFSDTVNYENPNIWSKSPAELQGTGEKPIFDTYRNLQNLADKNGPSTVLNYLKIHTNITMARDLLLADLDASINMWNSITNPTDRILYGKTMTNIFAYRSQQCGLAALDALK